MSTVTVAMTSIVSQEGQASCHQDGLVLAPPRPGLAHSQKSVPDWAWSVYLCVICVFYFGENSYLMLD